MPSSSPIAPHNTPTVGAKYQRVLIKVSGEALMGDKQFGQDMETVQRICRDIKEVRDLGVQVCLVTGGGNIFRGVQGAAQGMERASADYMGMLATVMNALGVQNVLEQMGVETRVLSAIEMKEVCEPYIRRRAIRHMEQGRVVICAAGTGIPFFTTDTTASLRAVETGCDLMIKGTQVDGVYDADPRKVEGAKHISQLGYMDVLQRDLKVMDASAISLARENKLPIMVCSIRERGCFARAICHEGKFTLIQDQ